MSADRLTTVDRVVRRGITAGAYPGASVVVGRKGYAVWQKGYGRLGWTTTSPAVVPEESIYDLASLTKVIATTTAAMILYDEGKLDLKAPVQRYLPEFTGDMKDQVTIEHLLTHRSGLAPGRQLWKTARTPAEAKQQVLESRLQQRPGALYNYSDLGPDILGWVIERISGQSLDQFTESRIFAPLGMDDTGWRPARALVPRIAPTEVTPPRGYPVRGEVADESAFALGGIAGHAGLFGTATDLSVFAQMMINGGEYEGTRIVKEETVRLFTTEVQDHRALGWEVAAGERGAGEYLSHNAFGHTGYTGTSIWIDPDRDLFVILLTNRVHAARARRPGIIIADVRHDLADAAALAVTDEPLLRQVAWPRTFRVDQAADWTRGRPLPKRPTTKAKRK
ncbi:MAG: serine hydrolase [Gemmatimonadetes bacterium]|nr:serine hydrolase [Gemmatimonadota bacterium]